ncbi:MAG: alpha/beta hydrolase [Anaerolineae bacterium]|nr:alpha/beta hydrolase [Anaerolineae bacterium]
MKLQWRDPDMSFGKWIKTILLVGLPFLLLYAAGKPILQSYVLAHPRRLVAELSAADVGVPVERVTFQATDGVELVGWFVPGEGGEARGGGTVVYSHGSGTNGPEMYSRAAFLNRAGYNVFLFDHRAHGQSGGRATTLGPLEVRDLDGAVAYLRSRPDVDPERIGAWGGSMGAGVVIGAAAGNPAIRAIVADSVYADMAELWHRFGYVGIRRTPIRWSWGVPMRWATWLWTGEDIAAFKPVELIARIGPRPVLIIHGERDNGACTVSDARRLYRASGEPKELWIVPGAGHGAAHALYPQEYETRVRAFFDAALAAPAPSP